jgi:hypothetical protein
MVFFRHVGCYENFSNSIWDHHYDNLTGVFADAKQLQPNFEPAIFSARFSTELYPQTQNDCCCLVCNAIFVCYFLASYV